MPRRRKKPKTPEQLKAEKRAYMREYRAKNLERILQANRDYYWAHREQLLAYAREYRRRKEAEMTDKEREARRLYNRTMYQIYKERGILKQ